MGLLAALASLGYDPFSGEFWKNLPGIMKASWDNPLGVALVIVILVVLALVYFGVGSSEKFKGWMALGVVVIGLAGLLYVGDWQLGKTHATRAAEVAVSGHVIDKVSGDPVVRATVTLATKGVPLTTLTNTSGYWVVNNLDVPAGTHVKISVTAAGYQSYEGDIPANATDEPPPIALTPVPKSQAPAPVHDGKGKTVVGTVFTRDRTPVEGAEVLVESSNPPRQKSAITVSDGSFRVFDVIPRPDMKITVRASGYKPKVGFFSPEDLTHSIEILLEPVPAR